MAHDLTSFIKHSFLNICLKQTMHNNNANSVTNSVVSICELIRPKSPTVRHAILPFSDIIMYSPVITNGKKTMAIASPIAPLEYTSSNLYVLNVYKNEQIDEMKILR